MAAKKRSRGPVLALEPITRLNMHVVDDSLASPRGDAATLCLEHEMAQDEADREREWPEDELDEDPFENWYGSWPY